jgi:hypothetical protein
MDFRLEQAAFPTLNERQIAKVLIDKPISTEMAYDDQFCCST